MEALIQFWEDAHELLFTQVVQPVLLWLGAANFLEDGYLATLWLLVGALQLLIMLVVFMSVERWRPVEPLQDRRAVAVDVTYSLIHRLGLFRLFVFLSVTPWVMEAVAWLRVKGIDPWQLDMAWPGVTDLPWVSLLIYLVAFDFIDYWLHRGQHSWRWWWALHALHHSQRQMTVWSDQRNHLLDDLLRDVILALSAHLIGVGPAQFVAIVAITQLWESFTHANVRLRFAGLMGGLLVSPHFHRLHHAVAVGHESRGPGSHGGHNYAVLFPVWDIVFRTRLNRVDYLPTGVRDQARGRDYGRGFWAQQWLGVLRLFGRA